LPKVKKIAQKSKIRPIGSPWWQCAKAKGLDRRDGVPFATSYALSVAEQKLEIGGCKEGTRGADVKNLKHFFSSSIAHNDNSY
jgi:hypothetical protein